MSFAVPRIDENDEAELAAMFAPEPWSAGRLAQRALHALHTHGGPAAKELGATAQRLYRKASPELRAQALRVLSVLRVLVLDKLAPQLGALRRMTVGLLSQRRRRKTTAPYTPPQAEASGLARTLVLGVMGAAALAMAAYAFAPSSADEPLALHRPVKPLARAAAVCAAEGEATAPNAPPVAPVPLTAPDPLTMPSATRIPASSPFAVDVRGQKTASAAHAVVAPASAPRAVTGKVQRFGAASVPHGKRFTLRMSAPIVALQGLGDDGGFSVVAVGGLALDRAGPISSALPAVKRSMIINKGDRAELTLRFADGKHPAYQVSADGNTLSVVIEEL